MQTKNVKVCNMEIFGNTGNFHMDVLQHFCEKHPVFEKAHKNSFYMFLVIDNAAGSVIIDRQEISMGTSKIIIIPPNCINQVTISKNSIGKAICFSETFFSLRYNENKLEQFSFLTNDIRSSLALSQELKNLTEQMYLEFTAQKKGIF